MPDHESAGSGAAICHSLTMFIFISLSLWHSALLATDDWPMWRSDASRSAASNNALPSEFELLWEKQLPPRRQAWDDPLNLDLMTYHRVFVPIVLDGRIFVGFNDQDKLLALDADTGRELWTFYTEAPVRLPPVGWQGRIYVTSDDGFLYCLSADDGQLRWKFSGLQTRTCFGQQTFNLGMACQGRSRDLRRHRLFCG